LVDIFSQRLVANPYPGSYPVCGWESLSGTLHKQRVSSDVDSGLCTAHSHRVPLVPRSPTHTARALSQVWVQPERKCDRHLPRMRHELRAASWSVIVSARSRVRRIAKWAGTAAVVLILATWAIGLRWILGYRSNDGWDFGLGGGRFA